MQINCVFCKIIKKEIPTELIYEDNLVIAFNDLSPQAPTHILIVPKFHVENAAQLAISSTESIVAIFRAVNELVTNRSISDYRTIFNTGSDAGQSVFHAHLHLMAGRKFAWPPG